MKEKEPMVEKTWEEFYDTGLLWFANTVLHIFGWAIVINVDEGKIKEVYPARVRYRGFDEATNAKNCIKVTEYLKQEIDELLIEAKE